MLERIQSLNKLAHELDHSTQQGAAHAEQNADVAEMITEQANGARQAIVRVAGMVGKGVTVDEPRGKSQPLAYGSAPAATILAADLEATR